MELRASLELKGMHRDAIQVGIFRFLSSVDRQKICSHKDTAHRVQVVQVVLWRLAETLKMNDDIVKPRVFKMNFAVKQISQGQYLMSLPRNSSSAGLVCGVLYIEATLLLTVLHLLHDWCRRRPATRRGKTWWRTTCLEQYQLAFAEVVMTNKLPAMPKFLCATTVSFSDPICCRLPFSTDWRLVFVGLGGTWSQTKWWQEGKRMLWSLKLCELNWGQCQTVYTCSLYVLHFFPTCRRRSEGTRTPRTTRTDQP